MSARVTFCNYAVSGFGSEFLVEDGTTLEEFLAEQDVSADEGSFRVSVNGQVATRGQHLADGDKVRLTPRKMPGA